MVNKEELRARLDFRKQALNSLREAYKAISEGGVQSYAIGSRNLTKLDLTSLGAEIRTLEKECDVLQNEISGKSKRKQVAVIPRW